MTPADRAALRAKAERVWPWPVEVASEQLLSLLDALDQRDAELEALRGKVAKLPKTALFSWEFVGPKADSAAVCRCCGANSRPNDPWEIPHTDACLYHDWAALTAKETTR